MAIRENLLDRMSRINAVKKQCLNNKTSYFVEHGESSTTVFNNRLEEDQIVNIVMNDKDGPDSAFVFGLTSTDIQVGDYLTWKDTTNYLIYEKVHVVKEVDYNKFKAFECNVQVNDAFYGYLISSKQAAKDITMSNQFEASKLLFTLVCPISCGLEIDQSIKINGQVWDIVEADTISNAAIGYYYIERGTNTKKSTGRMPKDKVGEVYSGTTLKIPTVNGFYESDVPVEVIERTHDYIVIKVPRTDFSITVGEVNARQAGAKVTKKYTVKETV